MKKHFGYLCYSAVNFVVLAISFRTIGAATLKIEPAKSVPDYSKTNIVSGALSREPGFNIGVGDFNKDGRSDLAGITFTYDPATDSFNRGTVSVYLQDAAGAFVRAADYLINTRTGLFIWGDNFFVADFNEDTNLDLLTDDFGGSGLKLLLGREDGSFQSPVSLAIVAAERKLAVSDVDKDGHLDIAVGKAVSGVYLYRGIGDGTFMPVVTLPTTGEVHSISVTRFTDDDAPDLVLTTTPSGARSVAVLPAVTPGQFQTAVITPINLPTFGARSAEVADFNGDGIPDYAAVYQSAETVEIWLGKADSTFEYKGSYPAGADCWRVFSGDVNSDGIQDLLVDSSWGQTAPRPAGILIGNGDGSFQPPVEFPWQDGMARHPMIADMNGDGIPDLLANFAAGTGQTVSLNVVLGLGLPAATDATQGLHLSITEAGPSVLLEKSIDLSTWTEVLEIPGSTFQFIDRTVNEPRQFYRTRHP